MAAVTGVMTELVSQLARFGPNGIASEIWGNSVERLYQKINCTSSGVPRKNQMNSDAEELARVSFDNRAIASTSPSAVPITIATTVNPRLTERPLSTVRSKK